MKYYPRPEHNNITIEAPLEEVEARFAQSTGEPLSTHMATLEQATQRICSANCCFTATVIEHGAATEVIVGCALNTESCVQRNEEGFVAAQEFIRSELYNGLTVVQLPDTA